MYVRMNLLNMYGIYSNTSCRIYFWLLIEINKKIDYALISCYRWLGFSVARRHIINEIMKITRINLYTIHIFLFRCFRFHSKTCSKKMERSYWFCIFLLKWTLSVSSFLSEMGKYVWIRPNKLISYILIVI